MSTKKSSIDETEIIETIVEKIAEPMASEKESMVYVGPTINGVAVQYTVYNNGISAELKTAIEAMPVIGNLIVPITKLSSTMQNLSNHQGAMHIQFEKAKQYKPKKGE